MIPGQSIKVVVATKPVDFRKGHDGLAARACAPGAKTFCGRMTRAIKRRRSAADFWYLPGHGFTHKRH
jgi:hypothetical protein